MSDAIGAMRVRLQLQRPTRTPDALGGAPIAWVSEGDAWAAVEAGSAGQRAAYDAAPSVNAYRFTINRRDDVRAGWRVVWDERVLRVVGVRDEGGPRIVLFCEEEVL